MEKSLGRCGGTGTGPGRGVWGATAACRGTHPSSTSPSVLLLTGHWQARDGEEEVEEVEDEEVEGGEGGQ